MEYISVDDFDKICRTCLAETDLKNSCLLEDTQNEHSYARNSSVSKLLALYLDFRFDEHDKLPKNICQGCTTRITEFHKFTCDCYEKQIALEKIFKKSIEEKCNNIKIETEELPNKDNEGKVTSLINKEAYDHNMPENFNENVKMEITEIELYKENECKPYVESFNENFKLEITHKENEHFYENVKLEITDNELCEENECTPYVENLNTNFMRNLYENSSEKPMFNSNNRHNLLYTDSDLEMECTPPERIEGAAEGVLGNVLPPKSKDRYEKAYKVYNDWCVTKGMHQNNSENVVLAYFSEMAKTKKSSTLWSIYSMMKTIIKITENVDISKYSRLIAFLKLQNTGYTPRKSNILSKDEVDRFIKEAPLKFLAHKVAAIIGISGACSSDELYKMEINHIDFLENGTRIRVPNTNKPRAFVITNLDWINVLKEYITLRSKANIKRPKLFMQLRFGKITNQAIGHNTVALFPRKIAVYLKLKNALGYTGHCFRRTAAKFLANSAGYINDLEGQG